LRSEDHNVTPLSANMYRASALQFAILILFTEVKEKNREEGMLDMI